MKIYNILTVFAFCNFFAAFITQRYMPTEGMYLISIVLGLAMLCVAIIKWFQMHQVNIYIENATTVWTDINTHTIFRTEMGEICDKGYKIVPRDGNKNDPNISKVEL